MFTHCTQDAHDTSSQVNTSVHGHSGTVADSLANFPSSLDPKVMAVTEELHREFPYNLDMNDGNELGVGEHLASHHYRIDISVKRYMLSTGFQLATVRNGEHESSATAYLEPAFVQEHDIDVVLNTLITRILPDNKASSGGSSLRFRTVEASTGPNTGESWLWVPVK